jgi:tagatose 6-phosphate kinase
MHLCLGTTPTVQQNMTFKQVVVDDVNRAVEVRRSASGKPINVARVLRTIGEEVMLCVPLGGDTGKFIREDLDAAGIAHDVVEIPKSTRTCVTVINQNEKTATELIEESSPLPAEVPAELLARMKAQLPRCKTAVFSGKLAPGSGDDFYAHCCELAHKHKVPVILDASGTALLYALKFRPLIIKPNRDELAATLGRELNDELAVRGAMVQLHRQGAHWAVITMGKDGAAASDGKHFWKIPAIPVDVVSPIGSGDAFSAGLAAGIAAGRDVPDACRLGVACAAANTLIPGAGFLRLEDVRRLEPLARIEPG